MSFVLSKPKNRAKPTETDLHLDTSEERLREKGKSSQKF